MMGLLGAFATGPVVLFLSVIIVVVGVGAVGMILFLMNHEGDTNDDT